MPLPFLFSCANVAIGDDFSHHPLDSGRQPPAIIVQETVPVVPIGISSDVAVFIAAVAFDHQFNGNCDRWKANPRRPRQILT